MKKSCLNCKKKLNTVFLNLGRSPIANNFSKEQTPKKKFNLTAMVCDSCYLVQVDPKIKPEDFFEDYSYQSGHSLTWLEHCKNLSDVLIKKFSIKKNDTILEIASNDGTQLSIFKKKGFKNLFGVDPSKNLSLVLKKKKINIFCNFFSKKFSDFLIKKKIFPKIIIANNVIAHIPHINDFCLGVSNLLEKSAGIASIEFHYLINLIRKKQFDTIYHEHHFYHSLYTLNNILKKNNLKIFDLQKINTHGGSIRIFVAHENNSKFNVANKVKKQIRFEINIGVNKILFYKKFKEDIKNFKKYFTKKFSYILEKHNKIAAYGAAAKGTTFLNFMNINKKKLTCVYDKNPYKQGRYMAGSLIPVRSPSFLIKDKPDVILVLIWNLKKEIIKQLKFTKKWKCKIIFPLPKFSIF
jgi:hypothetical protein